MWVGEGAHRREIDAPDDITPHVDEINWSFGAAATRRRPKRPPLRLVRGGKETRES